MEDTNCPICGKEMNLIPGKWGNFYGCSDYPKCNGKRQSKDSKPRFSNPLESRAKDYIPDFSWFELTEYHQSIAKVFKSRKQNIVVSASAGSGKSTFSGWLFTNLTTSDLEVGMVCFNRDPVKGMIEKTPYWVYVDTTGGMGNKNIGNARKSGQHKAKFEEDKVYIHINSYMDELLEQYDPRTEAEEMKSIRESRSGIKRVVDLLRSTMMKPNEESVLFLCNRYNVSVPEENKLDKWFVQTCLYIYDIVVKDENLYDYEDQNFWCATSKVPCRKFDILICDEAQDFTTAQRRMVGKSLKPNGILVAIGDPFQSIYGFRSADCQSIQKIIDEFNAVELPLPITYRSSKAVVRFVNKQFPHIKYIAWGNAVEGSVDEATTVEKMMATVKSGDMVLCRNNAPLVKPCFALIRRGIKATIKGRDIGSGLIDLIDKVQKKSKAENLDSLIVLLREHKLKMTEKFAARNQTSKIEELDDKVETIINIAEDIESIERLKEKISSIFTDDVVGVVFSSVHKAKGLEADNVFIIRQDLMPSKMAKNDDDRQQEENIRYVAYTRAKVNLYLVVGDGAEQPGK